MKRTVLAAIIVVCAASGAPADLYSDGRGQDFSWTNAQDEAGLYGQPFGSPTSNEIFFPFSNFNVHSGGGDTMTVGDSFEVDLIADEGNVFTHVTFFAQGEYSITGPPGESSFEATGELTVESLVGDPFFGFDSYRFFDDQPTEGSQPWEGYATVEIPLPDPDPVTALHLEVSQEMVAISSPDGSVDMTAYFNVFGIRIGVPEPCSLLLLAVGGLGLLRRR